MAMKTADFQTWKPQIDAYIQNEMDQRVPSLYEKLFTVKNTNRLQLEEVDYGSYAPMQSVGELGDAIEDEAIEGYKAIYQATTYRKSVTFSSDLLETDQTGSVKDMAAGLPRTVQDSRNLYIFGTWRKAFDTTVTYGDGLQLASIARTLKTAGYTTATTFTDGVQLPLGYDSALALQDVLIGQVSQTGNLMQVGAPGKKKILWGSPYLREQLFQIAGVKTSTEKPGTADRNTNYFTEGDKFDVLIVPWVSWEAARLAGETTVAKTSASNYWDSMWGVLDADLFKRNAKVFVRTGYERYDDEVIKSNQAFVKYAYDKYAVGYTQVSSLGFTISKGDNTTFSS